MNRGTNTNVDREQYERDLAKIEREKLAFEKKQEAFEEQKIKQDYESGIRNGVYDENMPSPLDMTDMMLDPKLSWEDNMLLNGYDALDIDKMYQDYMLYITLKSLNLLPSKNLQAGGATTPDPTLGVNVSNASLKPEHTINNSATTPTGPNPATTPTGPNSLRPVSANHLTSSENPNFATPNISMEIDIDALREEGHSWPYIKSLFEKEGRVISCKAFVRLRQEWDARQRQHRNFAGESDPLPATSTEDELIRQRREKASLKEERVNLLFNFIREKKLKDRRVTWEQIKRDYNADEHQFAASDAVSAGNFEALFPLAKAKWEEYYMSATKSFDEEKFAADKLEFNVSSDNVVKASRRRDEYRDLPNSLSKDESFKMFAKLGYNYKEWKEEWDFNHNWLHAKPLSRWSAASKFALTGVAAATFVLIVTGGGIAASTFMLAGSPQAMGAAFMFFAAPGAVGVGMIGLKTVKSIMNAKAEQHDIDVEFLEAIFHTCTAHLIDTQKMFEKLHTAQLDKATTEAEAAAAERKADAQALKDAAAAAKGKAEKKEEEAAKKRELAEDSKAAQNQANTKAAAAAREKADAEAKRAKEEADRATAQADKLVKEAAARMAAVEEAEDKERKAVAAYFAQVKLAENKALGVAAAWALDNRVGFVGDFNIAERGVFDKAFRIEMRDWCTQEENQKKYVKYLKPVANGYQYCNTFLVNASVVPALPQPRAPAGRRGRQGSSAPPEPAVPQPAVPQPAAPQPAVPPQEPNVDPLLEPVPAGGAQKNLSSSTNNVESQLTPDTIKRSINILSIIQKNTIPEYMKNYIFDQVSQHVAAVNAANNATQSAGYRKTQKRSHRKSNMRKTRAH